MMPQQYCLRWKHHHSNVQSMFSQLLEKERFCDVTLYCSPSFASQLSNKDSIEPQNIRGVSLRAHRVVLAACSELLGALLGAHEAHGEPVLVIDGAEPRHLKALLDYMYTGEMNVHHSQLASLLKTAEELRIKGLTDIRWNNKDEPPDYEAGVVATPTAAQEPSPPKVEAHIPKQASPKLTSPRQTTVPKHSLAGDLPRITTKRENGNDTERHGERLNVNGGPPPLIKLPVKEKTSPLKRERSDTESPSPKRQRAISVTDQIDEEMHASLKTELDQEWQHGNLDITAERVVGWGMGDAEATESSREGSEDEWADAPTDIGSFLHTKLRVDGDNSADEESNDSGAGPACRSTAASSSSSVAASGDIKLESSHGQTSHHSSKAGTKSSPTDPRFSDVVKLSDYLQHGRRPQFWEENYVKRVMEAVRVKELEMKQAAEILGVSYGTLYGRYRDVYGCINRPYSNMSTLHLMASTVQSKMDGDRCVNNTHQQSPLASRLANNTAKATRAVRDFWQAKGPSDVLERLQRGDMSLDAAARALGVTMANLAAHVADFGHGTADFEPIPIEVDPSLKIRSRTYSSETQAKATKKTSPAGGDKLARKVVIGRLIDEDPIPATVITMHEGKPFPSPAVTTVAPAAVTTTSPSGKWPSIRVASIDTLRGAAEPNALAQPQPPPASPSQLMRTRPDLTIVAARKPDVRREGDNEDT